MVHNSTNRSCKFTYLLGAFDGTGSKDWRKPDGSNSHVYQFYKRFSSGNSYKTYYDGPNTIGSNTKDIAAKGLKDLLKVLQVQSIRDGGPSVNRSKGGYQSLPLSASGDVRVVLVGHSRGGLIAAWIANELSRFGVPVYFMGLYDAVDRASNLDPFNPPEGSAFALDIDPDTLSNVFYTYHALRDPSMKSRTLFGNTARNNLNKTLTYQERLFQTSHGGIGGAPAPQAETMVTRGVRKNVYPLFSDTTCTPEQGEKRVRVCNNNSAAAQAWIVGRARSLGIPIG